MLRECARYEALAKILLYSEEFYNFFKFVEVSTFDIASDAFSTFKARPHELLNDSNHIRY
jgi:calcium binding protein 39